MARKTVRVALGEPDSNHRSRFENVVAHSRYELVVASAEVEPIFAAFRNGNADILVLDVEMAGTQVLPTLRKGFPGVRVIMSYEPLHADRILPALAQGALDAVKKPFDGSEVFDALFHAGQRRLGTFEDSMRRAGRVRLELPVEFHGPSSGLFSKASAGKVGDLSSGGLCLRTDQRFEPGEKIRIRLRLADGDGELRLKARVANRRAVEGEPLIEYGLEFRGLSSRLQRKIEDFLLGHLSGIPDLGERREREDER